MSDEHTLYVVMNGRVVGDIALRDLLRVEVDVVAADSLRGEFRDRVLREAVAV
ncbi:putative nucleotidyltransferase [Nocardioides daedukensis]|uniref:Putative nucleotidyltransferase n=1 Tax=Nocardioides daedukensis TaxID=634462 RepID=A0A7Y9RX99_9ACTN|nr:hypothetical protein [Nocardioides daedukensis]NYG57121.1 putative nucleotidyltransferase [Nocardioides daedukensis]